MIADRIEPPQAPDAEPSTGNVGGRAENVPPWRAETTSQLRTGQQRTDQPRTGQPPTAALPEIIKAKLRGDATVAAGTAATPAQPSHPLVARLRAVADAAKARLPRSSMTGARPSAAAARARMSQVLAAAQPAWLRVRKMQVPQIPQDVRDDLMDRGRRAGLNIGTTLDKIIREVPAANLPAVVPVADDLDISTIAIRRAVKQPSIFAPGHLLTALLTGGIIHIATTFAITAWGTGSAYRQLRAVLPVNELVVLPAQTPGAQILPYLAPDMIYAFCRFDLSRGAVQIKAVLPEAGWSLALYTRQGDNFYATPGQAQRPIPVSFVLAPASDRLINLSPGVRKNDVDANQVTSPDTEGLLVIRAPLKGVAFETIAQTELKRATCMPANR